MNNFITLEDIQSFKLLIKSNYKQLTLKTKNNIHNDFNENTINLKLINIF